MKARKLKQENENKAEELKLKFKQIGLRKSARMLGVLYPDIQAWIKGRRNWTFDKILKLAEKFNI